VDLWIEVLHWLGAEPRACLAFTLGVDFEGDQWTFFKPPLADLQRVYGLEIQELNVWRPLSEHVLRQMQLGRLVISEADAYYLPDTVGTTYHAEHSKTSIAIRAIDLTARSLGYFHAAGYHQLEGADFDGLFRQDSGEPADVWLAPYVELVKLDGLLRLAPRELTERATSTLEAQMRALPRSNPVDRYRPCVGADLSWLGGQDMAVFHRYAFATLRQLGASAELAAVFLRWLTSQGEAGLEFEAAAEDFDQLCMDAKTLMLRAARAANGRNAGDWSTILDSMAVSWTRATRTVRETLARPVNLANGTHAPG
jgi:hypothetical protein